LVGKLNAGARANKELFEKNDYKNIVFTDFIPNSQRDWLYQHAEAYIFPSLTEGFGLPGLEAMGYGAPVISSDATCLPEVYGDAAQYFNPLDIDNIATSIDTVISDETLQKELARKGYFKIKEYSWKRMAEQTLQVYNEVLTNSPEK
jgi:glycosyltransferase involved in cell wall biosynthesis